MTRAVIVLVAAVAATLLYVGPGQNLLPSALRLQAANTALQAPHAPPAGTEQPAQRAAGTTSAPAALPPSNTSVNVAVQPAARTQQGYAIAATVRASDGKPMSEVTVRFYETVELFGSREMFIASALTDGRGDASIIYLPARTGEHELVVRFAGKNQQRPALGRTTFEASVAAPPYRQEPMPLSAFAAGVPYAVGLIVLAVWGLIAFALFGTARGVIGGARSTSRREKPA